MSSEEEATAANVLSQMSQIQQISCETIEATVINVGHHCDVETTAPPQGWFSFKPSMLIGRIDNRWNLIEAQHRQSKVWVDIRFGPPQSWSAVPSASPRN